MIAIVAPYRVTDLDSKEARVIEGVIGVYEDETSYVLCFGEKEDYQLAKNSIHLVCIINTYDVEKEIKIEKESLMSILL